VIGPDEKEIAQAKKILSELYGVKDIGVAKYFLGVEIHQEDDGSMSLSQTSYINKLCDRYTMKDAKASYQPDRDGVVEQTKVRRAKYGSRVDRYD
jgi:Reverse transcriptase (RNA-dependent DNA polymerase)